MVDEIQSELQTVETNASEFYFEQQNQFLNMKLQLDSEQIIAKVETLMAVSNDIMLYLSNPFLFAFPEQ